MAVRVVRDRDLMRELGQLDPDELPTTCRISWDDPDKLYDINLTVSPVQGDWNGGEFQFHILIPEGYKNYPPIVTCKSARLQHPNIDSKGVVFLSCLKLSRFGFWSPTARPLTDVIWGLHRLFIDINFGDPFNYELAIEF